MSAHTREIAQAHRFHLGLFGPCNSGKSACINALTQQDISIVSPHEGTTTDVVKKSYEWPEVGACVLLDTAGFDEDQTHELSKQRIEASEKAWLQIDAALLFYPATQLSGDIETKKSTQTLKSWIKRAHKDNRPYKILLSQVDCIAQQTSKDGIQAEQKYAHEIQELARVLEVTPEEIYPFSIQEVEIYESTYQKLTTWLKGITTHALETSQLLTAGLVHEGDRVVLVMPQDKGAPQGRLIQAQSQMIRELLDLGAITICVTPEQLPQLTSSWSYNPPLVICDSQVFKITRELTGTWPLTSFSVLFAAYKDDWNACLSAVDTLKQLHAHSRILIAEACAHKPLEEDIGRVKIPMLLRKRFGESLSIDFVNGTNLPDETTMRTYDLVIQCGGCMFTRTHMQSRGTLLREAGVPVCNYGLTLAWLQGVLDEVVLPYTSQRQDV